MVPPFLVSATKTLKGWSKVVGGVNPRCPCDQETSSLGSEDAPSRVDTIGVIT